MQNICLLTKFSELSKRAKPSAINVAKKYGAKLHELHVLETLRDRQEISWTIWGPSVPDIWSRPIERNHRRSRPTSRILQLRSYQRGGAIGHSKVQVISCRSLS